MKFAKDTWNEFQVSGWAGFMILQKLKVLKDKLRVWNKEVFGDVKHALQQTEAEAKLHQFEVIVEERQLTEVEKASRCKTKTEFWRLYHLTESMWRQKFQISWLKFRDKNTRYFQVMANNRFWRNKEIKEAAVEYFRTNFKEEQRSEPVLGGVFIRKLNPLVSSDLEKQFEEGGILSALKDCSSLKALGSDGFNFSFVKKGRVFMKPLILQFFSEFHANGKLTKGFVLALDLGQAHAASRILIFGAWRSRCCVHFRGISHNVHVFKGGYCLANIMKEGGNKPSEEGKDRWIIIKCVCLGMVDVVNVRNSFVKILDAAAKRLQKVLATSDYDASLIRVGRSKAET
ncbi:hypothetical protein RHMOL_Rhmol07G0235800 [Rhododendron molle]|uniref:Uncharacterized protein n=1 Tax=Rhododendron molle TaxID=49168 RepID=A0ACC0N554_RHOML|nr:hypothetical protein RHMOL_Rhmol07G0235800 [Rhododendron molle]